MPVDVSCFNQNSGLVSAKQFQGALLHWLAKQSSVNSDWCTAFSLGDVSTNTSRSEGCTELGAMAMWCTRELLAQELPAQKLPVQGLPAAAA